MTRGNRMGGEMSPNVIYPSGRAYTIFAIRVGLPDGPKAVLTSTAHRCPHGRMRSLTFVLTIQSQGNSLSRAFCQVELKRALTIGW